MTLINLQSRIHFANNILEEALHGEIEETGARNVLIIAEDHLTDADIGIRVASGLPKRCAATVVTVQPNDTKYDVWDRASAAISPADCDGLVAYGSARAIGYARKCRVEIAKLKYARVKPKERGERWVQQLLPDYLVVPGVDGLPNPCCDPAQMRSAFRGAPPSVIICDPDVTNDVTPPEYASAYANALGRCIEALGHSAFNPVADGFATEGLRRLVLAKPVLQDHALSREAQRDLMAAVLNGAMAQQKGGGLLQAIHAILCEQTGRELDPGVLNRILLPDAVPDLIPAARRDVDLVHQIFGFPTGRGLADGLRDLLDDLPLIRNLKALRLARNDLENAADTLAADTRWRLPPAHRIEGLLEAVY